MQCCRLTACFIALFSLPPALARPQNHTDPYVKRPIAAVKTATPPAIDGDLSDPAWKEAPKASVFVDRQNGRVVADQTIAYILYDEQSIYVAFHCKDSEPDQITARETIRDSQYQGNSNEDSEDNIEVIFDPFQSHRYEDLTRFSLNAIGTRSARLGGGRGGKREWKGDWDGAVQRAKDGWTAEMRIPWAILNYPNSKQPITMGLNFRRFQYRTRLESIWSNTGPRNFNDLQGLWTGVEVPQGAFRPTLSLLPYILPGSKSDEPAFRSGLDARYSITPELTLIGSLNPDFGTIEGAVEGIQFSRSERFVPERRPFFLEGQDYFRAGQVYAIGNFFYPNRIQAFDLGTKVYGKITPVDTLGFLHTIDFNRSSDIVARYRRDLSPTSNIGLFFTQKSARDDNNTVGALLQESRWGKFGLSSQWALSTGQSAGGTARQINFTYSDKLNFWSLQYLDVSPKFRDANGLIFFNDYRGIHLFSIWSAEWRSGFWRRFEAVFFPQYDWHTNGRPFRRGAGMEMLFETRSDWAIGFDTTYQKFDAQTDHTYGLMFRNGVTNRFRQWGLRAQTGRLADRPSSFIGPEFSLRLLRKFDIAYSGSVLNLNGRTEQHVTTLNYELSPTRSIGGRVVIQNADTNWYLSYRNSGEKGTEVFFILGDPNATRFVEQALVKFIFAL